MIDVSASIMCADLSFLHDELKRCEDAGVDSIHVDIMDGLFVDNFAIGFQTLQAIKRSTSLPISVHLMTYKPHRFVDKVIEFGADECAFHIEATEDCRDTIQFIKTCGKRAGLALSPSTPTELLYPYLKDIDYVIIMGVEPGFSGQPINLDMVDRIRDLKHLFYEQQLKNIQLCFDGGVNQDNISLLKENGVDCVISGSFFFSEINRKQIVDNIKNISGVSW